MIKIELVSYKDPRAVSKQDFVYFEGQAERVDTYFAATTANSDPLPYGVSQVRILPPGSDDAVVGLAFKWSVDGKDRGLVTFLHDTLATTRAAWKFAGNASSL